MIYQDGIDSLLDARKVKPLGYSLIEKSENNIFKAIDISTNNDFLLQSQATGKQYLLKGDYKTDSKAPVQLDKIRLDNKPILISDDSKKKEHMCFNQNGTESVVVDKSSTGAITSLWATDLSSGSSMPTRLLFKNEGILFAEVQCLTGYDGKLQAVIDVVLSKSMELDEVPDRLSQVSNNEYTVFETTSAGSNHLKIYYDGESILTVPGYLRVNKDKFRVFRTPLAADVFLDREVRGSDQSVLSTLDYTVSINVPDNPMAVIEYPKATNDMRVYCVYGHTQSDIYRSCYEAVDAKTR